ncbi:MAG: HAD-IC family P-type ATPase [Bacteroidales bacterium]
MITQGDELYKVFNFAEIPAMGISGEITGIRINIGSAEFVKGKKDEEEGLMSRVYVYFDYRVLGYFQIENSYRRGLKEVIESLSKNFQLHLVTGDNEAEKKNLLAFFPDGRNLNFNQSPTDKLQYIRKLKEEGNTVLMIGDGLNDAGALQESDVGISIADDVYHFSPACDAILESGKFHELNKFILFTQTSINIVWVSFIISFLYNVVGLYFAVQGLLTPIIAAILMPISSVSVVAFATFAVSYFFRKRFRK